MPSRRGLARGEGTRTLIVGAVLAQLRRHPGQLAADGLGRGPRLAQVIQAPAPDHLGGVSQVRRADNGGLRIRHAAGKQDAGPVQAPHAGVIIARQRMPLRFPLGGQAPDPRQCAVLRLPRGP